MSYPENHDGDQSVEDESYRASATELRQFVERIEKLESEKAEIQEFVKEVFSEAKSRGYDTKAIREVIKQRKQDKDERDEFEAIVELYRQTLGM